LGITAETLRKWLRQAKVDAGKADGVTSQMARENRELKRKNAELERTVEILKAWRLSHESSCGCASSGLVGSGNGRIACVALCTAASVA
jgi:hypothetical protein